MNAADVVLENTAYHAQLLAAIAELDWVPPALEQQESYITGLEHQSRQLAAKIESLEMQTKKEQAEHEALRDSTTRRFAATITGRKDKYEAKASKEEREYVEALERERYYKRQQTTLMNMIQEAKAADLAELYSKIFDGPTQDFAEDDQLEWQLQAAQSRYNEIQGYLNRESQAVDLLGSANTALQSCASEMQEAISDSHWDMFGGIGVLGDMMERESLDNARAQGTRAQTFVQQAMMVSPQVQPIGEISIAHGSVVPLFPLSAKEYKALTPTTYSSIISDVIFDNIFTDFAFHPLPQTVPEPSQDNYSPPPMPMGPASLNHNTHPPQLPSNDLPPPVSHLSHTVARNVIYAPPPGPPPAISHAASPSVGRSASALGLPPAPLPGMAPRGSEPSRHTHLPPPRPSSNDPSPVPLMLHSAAQSNYAPPPGPPPTTSRTAPPSPFGSRSTSPLGLPYSDAQSNYAPPPGPPPAISHPASPFGSRTASPSGLPVAPLQGIAPRSSEPSRNTHSPPLRRPAVTSRRRFHSYRTVPRKSIMFRPGPPPTVPRPERSRNPRPPPTNDLPPIPLLPHNVAQNGYAPPPGPPPAISHAVSPIPRSPELTILSPQRPSSSGPPPAPLLPRSVAQNSYAPPPGPPPTISRTASLSNNTNASFPRSSSSEVRLPALSSAASPSPLGTRSTAPSDMTHPAQPGMIPSRDRYLPLTRKSSIEATLSAPSLPKNFEEHSYAPPGGPIPMKSRTTSLSGSRNGLPLPAHPATHVTEAQTFSHVPLTSNHAPPPLRLQSKPPARPPPAPSDQKAVPLSPPPAYTETEVTTLQRTDTPPHAPQHANDYVVPSKLPLLESTDIYAHTPVPPPVESHSASPSDPAPQPAAAPTVMQRANSASPRPRLTNSTSPRPRSTVSVNAQACAFPPPRTSSRLAPPSQSLPEGNSYVL
ncbi:hypothetical protein MSAN_00572000 [Mycena sanguinolenta]|uniref:Uncharacterized protein n=1 Tax=Mycena sanguinolenta TaxID=230812 RepID=A0A8H7DJI9_9AGAR|nr:hypothetical protein MSAN_00572000 [Mycena sanguinolenta]